MAYTLRQKLIPREAEASKDNILIGPMAGHYLKKNKRILVVRIGDIEFVRKLTNEEYKIASQFVNEILFAKGTLQRNIFSEKPDFNSL